MKKNRLKCTLLSAALVAQTLAPASVSFATTTKDTGEKNVADVTNTGKSNQSKWADRFTELYDEMMAKDSGYFDENGIPYHSVEKLMCEAPDYGHESTSEAASYLVWLQAMYGRITGDYSKIDDAWKVIENYFIPTDKDQPMGGYNPNSPATYADEYETPALYPAALNGSAGQDPIYQELKTTYNTESMYGMHWLVDVDNFYNFGQRDEGVNDEQKPVYINTFQRGQMEGCWNTIPQPSWENFQAGLGESGGGYLSYFTQQNGQPARQWRYTIASDADARVIQAMYRAQEWAEEDGKSISSSSVEKTQRMGDYLRYSMYDKYFMKVGAGKTQGTGKDSCMYLLSWYYAWGGDVKGQWSWKIGSSHNHFGYQNPFAAWVLSTDETNMVPESQTAQKDWADSFDRQLEFYQWLQSDEGAIAGGATNSWNGRYEVEDMKSKGVSTFYGMGYQEQPVYNNPGSNQWIGMQCWSMQRIAEVYYETGDERAKKLMDKWVAWIESELHMESKDEYLPATLAWSGQPGTWDEKSKSSDNSGLHVEVTAWGHDIGISASLANTLTYYAAAQKKYDKTADYTTHVAIAQDLLDRIWEYADDKGLGDPSVWDEDKIELFYADWNPETFTGVYVPENLSGGKMATGEEIKSGSFYDLRKNAYEQQVEKEKAEGTDTLPGSLTYCMENLEKKQPFEITYHRFWANVDAAIAYGVMDEFFPEVINGGSDTTEATTTEATTTEATTTEEQTTQKPTTEAQTTEDGKVTEAPTTTEVETEATTQKPTKAPTTTEAETEATTEATTQKPTKAPTTTEAETEATTEATTQKPTKAPTTTEAETEATTEATTQKPTKAPTTTEVATEGLTTTEAQATTTQTQGTEAPTTTEELIKVESVKINPSNVKLSRGDAQDLELVITPANASDVTAEWKSSNSDIVGISPNGTITANKAGTATITVTVGGKQATCEVTVTEPVTKVTLDADTISIVEGDTKTLTATVEPENATNKKLVWNSTNKDVATVDANGTVTAIKAGETRISVVSEDGSFTATCTVHVTAQTVAADGVKLDITSTSLAEGQKTTLKATVTPETATNKNVKWSSSDESVAKVNANGEVEAVKAGTATITVETEDGEFKKECTITVVAAKKNVQSVTITTAPTSLVVGGTMQLTYSIAPETATDKSVKWQSSDPKVLSVDENGVITANKVGEAYISVTTNDGSFTDGVMITVADAKIPVESISLPATPITLVEGEEKVVDLTITPANATERKIIWSSSNESVVTVDANGIVKAVGQGEATITATTTEGKQATCTVVVSKKAVDASVKVTDIILNPQSGSVDVGEQIVLTAYAFPDNATNKNIKWTTSDASIATVVNGVVTGKKAGNVTITATAEDGSGVSATCAIKVNGTESTAVDKVEIEQSSAELEVGESTTLTVNITPANADDKSLTWKSEDQSIAIVDSNGKVTAVAPGTTIVTVTTSNGKNASIPVKVTAKATTEETKVDVERVFVKEEGTTVTLNVGDTKTFTATVYPENASNKTVTWLSTDTDVADFASSLEGKLTAKKAGTTTIKVISADGKASTSFTVVVPGTGTTEQEPVTPTEVQITGLKLDKEQLTIDANTAKTATVTATIEPENAANKNVRFVSLNKSIATVDQTGKITAVANGNVVIAVLTEKGDFVQFCEVEVKNVAVQKDPEPVVTDTLKLSASTATIIPKQQFQLSATLKSTGNAAEGVTWSSTNPSKIKVDANGKVTAVATGTASVIATSADGTLSAVCNITVKSAKTTTLRYEITKFTSSAKEVRVTKAAKSSLKTVNIPKTVKLCGVTYKVVAVKDGAFKNNKKIRKVTIGQNVTKIGKQSFYGCKALKTLVIKSTKLTSAKVGSQAFASGAKAVTVSVPASKKASYKKILIKKGLSKKSTFKK